MKFIKMFRGDGGNEKAPCIVLLIVDKKREVDVTGYHFSSYI